MTSCVCSGEMHGCVARHGRCRRTTASPSVLNLCTPGFVMSIPRPAGTTIVLAVDEDVEVRVHVVLRAARRSRARARPHAPAPSDRSARATAAGSFADGFGRGDLRRHGRRRTPTSTSSRTRPCRRERDADRRTREFMTNALITCCRRRRARSPSRLRTRRRSPRRAAVRSRARAAMSKRFSSEIGTVLVTTTSRIGPFFRRSTAGPGEQAVRRRDVDVDRAAVDEQVRRAHHRARGVDHVVDDDARAAVDVTDDLGRDRDVVRALRPALVDERDVGAEAVGEPTGELAAAGVGSDDHRVARRRSASGTPRSPAPR